MSSDTDETSEPVPADPKWEGPPTPELLPELDEDGNKRSMYERLRPRRQQFVDAYFKHARSQTKAAAEVWPDYAKPAHKGWSVIREPGVREAIEEKGEIALEEAGIHRVQILLDVNEIKRRCMQASPVLDRKGNPVLVENAEGALVPAFTFDSMGALKASELLGKNARLWTDKTEISGPNGEPLAPPVMNFGFANGGPGESSGPSTEGP
jgi:phage terminase small subunit